MLKHLLIVHPRWAKEGKTKMERKGDVGKNVVHMFYLTVGHSSVSKESLNSLSVFKGMLSWYAGLPADPTAERE